MRSFGAGDTRDGWAGRLLQGGFALGSRFIEGGDEATGERPGERDVERVETLTVQGRCKGKLPFTPSVVS